MNRQEAARIVALAKAAFPWMKLEPQTAAVWAELLDDVTFEEALAATKLTIALSDSPPSIADVRAAVVETRLGLPLAYAAWNQVERRANWRAPRRDCVVCGGSGFTELLAAEICGACGGNGDLPDLRDQPSVHPVAMMAANRIGGLAAIRSGDLNYRRRDFLAAFAEVRQEAIRAESLTALGGQRQLGPGEATAR